ncbi:MAG: NUDIX hydrolase [Candidatus Nanohaloarchaea archaeon]
MKEIPVAKVLLRNDGGEFLVVKDRASGKWELPGGKIEQGEDRFEAASRELEEETCIELDADEFDEVVRVEVEDREIVNCWILFAEVPGAVVDLYEEELSGFQWVTAEDYRTMDWHADAGYGAPAMVYLEEYLKD